MRLPPRASHSVDAVPVPPPLSLFGGGATSDVAAAPCCSSSSSDEAELDQRGWPSVVSVLETPDRRRVRKSLRSATKKDTATPQTNGQQRPLMSTMGTPCTPLVMANAMVTRRRPAEATHFAQTTMMFNSPPATKRMRTSPSSALCTPNGHHAAGSHIHLSGSPMSAFFVRQRKAGATDGTSPQSNGSSSSSSFSGILRPLNMQNYIGIRFSGEQPEAETRARLLNAGVVGCALDEENRRNCSDLGGQSCCSTTRTSFGSEQRHNSVSAANDSGFFDASASSSSSSSSLRVETPSKGLARHAPSTPVKSTADKLALLSPHRATPLFLELAGTSCGASSFGSPHSVIQEQSYGALEATVLDGILNDLSLWPPSSSMQPQTPVKLASPLRNSPTRGCPHFERKLANLRRRRQLPGDGGTTGSTRRPGVPSSLQIEMEDHAAGEQPISEWNAPHELGVLFPELGANAFRLMFGQTSAQFELTRRARAFLRSLSAKEQLHRPTGLSRGAGLPTEWTTAVWIKMD